MAEVIGADGTRIRPVPKRGKTFRLEELQAIVGGYIQIIALSDGRLMVLNEEGKLKNLPPNHAATELTRDVLCSGDYIAGDVLVCSSKEVR